MTRCMIICLRLYFLLHFSLAFSPPPVPDLPSLLLKLLSCKIERTAGRIKNETWHHERTNLEEGHCCWLHLKRRRQSVSHVGAEKVKKSRGEDQRPTHCWTTTRTQYICSDYSSNNSISKHCTCVNALWNRTSTKEELKGLHALSHATQHKPHHSRNVWIFGFLQTAAAELGVFGTFNPIRAVMLLGSRC